MVIIIPFESYAATNNEQDQLVRVNLNENLPTFSISEYEQIVHLQSQSNSELLMQGYSNDEIEEIREFSFEEAIMERASYSTEQLLALGYDYDEIEIIQNYDGSPLSADSPVILALSAVCEGYINFNSYNANTGEYVFYYQFEWDKAPFFRKTDYYGVSWQAVDANGHYIYAEPSQVVCLLQYYSLSTSEIDSSGYNQYYCSEYVTPTIIPGFNGYYVEYESSRYFDNENGGQVLCWTKRGVMRVHIVPAGDYEINILNVYGAVGHTEATVSPSVGFSGGDSYSWSFSFTPQNKINTIATYACSLRKDGTKIVY